MNPFDLARYVEDEHTAGSEPFIDHVEELDSDDLRALHEFLHNGRAIAVKPDHEH